MNWQIENQRLLKQRFYQQIVFIKEFDGFVRIDLDPGEVLMTHRTGNSDNTELLIEQKLDVDLDRPVTPRTLEYDSRFELASK